MIKTKPETLGERFPGEERDGDPRRSPPQYRSSVEMLAEPCDTGVKILALLLPLRKTS
jgi:hypothetical protein